MLWRSSVLNVPLAGSKTNSELKLGLSALESSASLLEEKVRAGFLFNVKLSSSDSKSNDSLESGFLVGTGVGLRLWLTKVGCFLISSSLATVNKFWRAEFLFD